MSRVVATHLHPDHAGNAGWLTARFDAPLVMSQADFLMAHAWRDEAAGYSTDGLTAHLERNGLAGERLAALRGARQSVSSFGARFPGRATGA